MAKKRKEAPVQEESDDDAPEQISSSRASQEEQDAPLNTRQKKKPKPKARAREEKYWAEKEAGKDTEPQAAEEKEADGERKETTQGELELKQKGKAASGPLPIELLAVVQEEKRKAKEAAEITAALKRNKLVEAAAKRKWKQQQSKTKHPIVFGNIQVSSLNSLAREEDEVPPEVLAFAKSQGDAVEGRDGRKRRVPYTIFAKQKPKRVSKTSRGKRR